ncbi:hypothetical protein CPAV1605_773 [seawater metagenome]|uniref:Uncharacterized protein n=1 Tax=seawater metagenome TaxID=1561972 RepID=A0A5E8CI65_9ZZZZ
MTKYSVDYNISPMQIGTIVQEGGFLADNKNLLITIGIILLVVLFLSRTSKKNNTVIAAAIEIDPTVEHIMDDGSVMKHVDHNPKLHGPYPKGHPLYSACSSNIIQQPKQRQPPQQQLQIPTNDVRYSPSGGNSVPHGVTNPDIAPYARV